MDYQMDHTIITTGPEESISIRTVKEAPSSGSSSLAVLGADPDAVGDDSISAASYKNPVGQLERHDDTTVLLEDFQTFAKVASMMATATATTTSHYVYNFSDSPSSSTSYSPPPLLDSSLSPLFLPDVPSMDFDMDIDMDIMNMDDSNGLGLEGGVDQDWSSANWEFNVMESEMQKAIIEEDFFRTFQESILQEPLEFFSLLNTTTPSQPKPKQPKVIPFQPDFSHPQPLESDIGCLSFPSPLPSLPAKADGTRLTLQEEDTYEYEAIMTNVEYSSRERLAACWLPPNRNFLLQVSGSRRGRIMWGILLEWYIGEGWLVADPNPNNDDEQTNAYKVYRLSDSGIDQLMNVLRSRLKEEYTEHETSTVELEMKAITEAMEDLAVARSVAVAKS